MLWGVCGESCGKKSLGTLIGVWNPSPRENTISFDEDAILRHSLALYSEKFLYFSFVFSSLFFFSKLFVVITVVEYYSCRL